MPAISAAVAQLVEHFLGKDEVIGSNPISSFIFRAALFPSFCRKSDHNYCFTKA